MTMTEHRELFWPVCTFGGWNSSLFSQFCTGWSQRTPVTSVGCHFPQELDAKMTAILQATRESTAAAAKEAAMAYYKEARNIVKYRIEKELVLIWFLALIGKASCGAGSCRGMYELTSSKGFSRVYQSIMIPSNAKVP